MTLLVVMGSGETAPAMRRVHREVFAATGEGAAVMLDTPFGFQENADELTAKTRAYFAESVGRTVDVVPWRTAAAPAAQREMALAMLAEARWAFAGPGSPTYALGQWLGTPMPGALADVVRRGGTLVFGSAGAVTLGTHAIPVYEVYKVGAPAHWVPGLDLLGQLTGIQAALVPHYDNAEGATHDTRFCYLGERRLAALEAELPAEVGLLGVDEHTALVLDLDAGTARVLGLGGVTVRRAGRSLVLPSGELVPLGGLAALLRGEHASVAGGPLATIPRAAEVTSPPSYAAVGLGTDQPTVPDATSLREEARRAREAYDGALASRDVDGCVGAILGLEQAIVDWRADTLQSDDADTARRALRAMIVGLGELARVGARDPREVLGPLVELALGLRRSAREARDFTTSDLVRDGLAGAGITVRDTPAGAQWTLT
jgi:cyanophycinase-like exopeptidase